MFTAALPIIAAIAPYAAKLIGNLINGKEGQRVAAEFEPLVTGIATKAASLYGTDDPVRLEERVRADPEKAADLERELTSMAMQMQAQVRIAEIQASVQETQAAHANTASAREHQQRLAALGSISAHGANIISIIVVLGFFGVLILMVWRPFALDAITSQILNILVGVLAAAFTAVINYWLGSSRGSTSKDNALAEQASKSMDALSRANERLSDAAKPTQPPVVPPVVVVPPPPPEPPVAPPAGPETPSDREDPAKPAPPGIIAEVLPGLVRPHRHFEGSVTWSLLRDGIAIDGAAPRGTPGEPVTIRRIWTRYSDLCCTAAKHYGVPVELIVATIATESGGDPTAYRNEPQIKDASTGLMQTLLATARMAMGNKALTSGDLRDPGTSINAGTAYIAMQRTSTHFDPPLVAAAYNAGSLRLDNGTANRWKLRCYPIGTGKHVDTYVAFFNDCMRVSKADGWCSDKPGTPTFASCIEALVASGTTG